jgi:pimeloyl-ACP methyl ester carboxylesterase
MTEMVRGWIATSTVSVLLGATALVATGARFAAATEGEAGQARACDLLTTSEVSQIIGVTIPDADHMLHMTNPELAAAIIDEFLRLHSIQSS